MALKIKCNYTKTSNLRYPYQVRTYHLKFNFSNQRDAQKFCKQRTKDLKNLYISVLDSYSDVVLLVMQQDYRDLPLHRALEQIQYFIEHPDYREDFQRYERVCACAIASLIQIYRNVMNCKRLQKQWGNSTKYTLPTLQSLFAWVKYSSLKHVNARTLSAYWIYLILNNSNFFVVYKGSYLFGNRIEDGRI